MFNIYLIFFSFFQNYLNALILFYFSLYVKKKFVYFYMRLEVSVFKNRVSNFFKLWILFLQKLNKIRNLHTFLVVSAPKNFFMLNKCSVKYLCMNKLLI